MVDGIHTLAYGHTKLKKLRLKNELQWVTQYFSNSISLPNKPLSNLEIIAAAKKLSLYGFSGFFRDTLPTKTKLNECGILNFD